MKKCILIAALLSSWVACRKPQSFDFRGIKNIHLQQTALDNSSLSATMSFFNPNNFAVQVKKIDADVYMNNDFIAHYSLDTLIRVPANSLFDFDAIVNLATVNVLKNALASLFNQRVTFHIVGRTRVGRNGFFMNIPFDVNSEQSIHL